MRRDGSSGYMDASNSLFREPDTIDVQQTRFPVGALPFGAVFHLWNTQMLMRLL